MSAAWVSVPSVMRRHMWGLGALVALILVMVPRVGFDPALSQQPPTFPPTWTPTFTPTATHTPTVTPMPTPTATLTADEACEAFIVVDDQGAGASYPHTANFDLFIGTTVPDTTMRFLARHRLTALAVGVDAIEPVPLTSITVPMTALPRPGLYDWTMTLLNSDGEALCERGGYFFAGREEWITPTIEVPTSDTTPTVIYIVVTATPEGMNTPVPTPSVPAFGAAPFPTSPAFDTPSD